MECGSGASDDRYREVEYLLRGAYETFTATAAVSDVAEPEVRTQLEVFVDTVRTANTVLTGEGSTEVTADIDGGATLRLRLTCQHRDTVLHLNAATVTG